MTERLQHAIDRLPDELQNEVADFAEFLADRRKPAAPPSDDPTVDTRRLDISSWAGKLPPAFPGETGRDASHAGTAEMLRLAEANLQPDDENEE